MSSPAALSAAAHPAPTKPAPGPGRRGGAAPRAEALLGLALCAVAGCCLAGGHFSRYHNADSLMPTLVSTLRWTPFVWAQDRYGMLWPWLLQPLTAPLTNLLAITAVNVVVALLGHLLVARFLFSRRHGWLAGTASIAALCLAAPGRWAFETLGPVQFHATAIVLGLLALEVVARPRPRPWHLGLALVLLGLACWVNVATPALVGALVLARPRAWGQLAAACRGRAALARGGAPLQLALLAVGGALGYALMCAAPRREVELGFVPPGRWAAALRHTAGELWDFAGEQGAPWRGLPAACAACAALAAARGRRARRLLRRLLLPAGLALATAAAYACFVDLQLWAERNKFSARYWLAPALTVQLLLVGLAVLPAVSGQPRRRRLACQAALSAAAVAAVLGRFGAPSPAVVRADLLARHGRDVAAVVEGDAVLVAGDYWQVWPTVLLANAAHAAAGRGQRAYGLTERGEACACFWREVPPPRLRVAVADDQAAAAQAACDDFGLGPLVELERRGGVMIGRPGAAAP